MPIITIHTNSINCKYNATFKYVRHTERDIYIYIYICIQHKSRRKFEANANGKQVSFVIKFDTSNITDIIFVSMSLVEKRLLLLLKKVNSHTERKALIILIDYILSKRGFTLTIKANGQYAYFYIVLV